MLKYLDDAKDRKMFMQRRSRSASSELPADLDLEITPRGSTQHADADCGILGDEDWHWQHFHR